MKKVHLITDDKIIAAKEVVAKFLENHAWSAIKAHDEYYDVDSKVGEIKIINKLTGEESHDSNSSDSFVAFKDITDTAFFIATNLFLIRKTYPQGDELVNELAEMRVKFLMKYPTPRNPENETENYSQKFMLQRLGFDQFVKALGGEVLLQAALDKALEIMPDDPLLSR